MKSLTQKINEAFKPSVNDDHSKVVFDMLSAEYNNDNKSLMKALVDNDDKWFDNMCKDYAVYVTGCFGTNNEDIIKQAKEGCTKFKASVKMGLKK